MITNSEITNIDPQVDGRRYVTEYHTSDDGNDIIITYLAEEDADINHLLLDRQLRFNS